MQTQWLMTCFISLTSHRDTLLAFLQEIDGQHSMRWLTNEILDGALNDWVRDNHWECPRFAHATYHDGLYQIMKVDYDAWCNRPHLTNLGLEPKQYRRDEYGHPVTADGALLYEMCNVGPRDDRCPRARSMEDPLVVRTAEWIIEKARNYQYE